MMWKQIGLTAVVVAILAGSAAAVIVDNNNQGGDHPQHLNQGDGSGNPAGGGGNGNRAGQNEPGPASGGEDDHGDRDPRRGYRDAAEPVAEADWISLEGVVTAVSGSSVTIKTEAGEPIEIMLGPSRFLESLGATFEVDDELEVSGFYEDDIFYAAEVTVAASGEQITLRDADGSLLWNAGGGRQGQGGNGQPGGKGQPGSGQGNGGGGQGNGNGNGN